MDNGFWGKLKKPFFILAPMADVTDVAFRSIVAKYSKHATNSTERNGQGKSDGGPTPGRGGPDVFYTEFVSCDGLMSEGRDALLVDLKYSKNEKPVVAQLFGLKPENFYECAKLVKGLGFDGVDINMGCPDRSIEKQGAGAALMKDPGLAKEIVEATKEGAGGLPVSIKTRIGYNKNEINTWLPALLGAKPAVIILHARTRKELSKVPAHWDTIKDAVDIAKGSGTLIVGNGDVTDLRDGQKKAEETGADGIMLGRAVFGNPWLFNRKVSVDEISVEEKLRVMVEHTKLFEKLLGDSKNFAIMKKHYKAYVNGFDGAKELRVKLMEAGSAKEAESLVKEFVSS